MRYRDFDHELALGGADSVAPFVDLGGRPFSEIVNILAMALMEFLGPFCWAALILLFLVAELSPA